MQALSIVPLLLERRYSRETHGATRQARALQQSHELFLSEGCQEMSKKPHPLKGRKLTPEQIAARKAAVIANKANGSAPKEGIHNLRVKDAVYYCDRALGLCSSLKLSVGGRKAPAQVLEDIELFVKMTKRTLEGGL